MVNRSIRMNLQWSSPAPCLRAARVAHKRLDSDDQPPPPPAKCARLSAEAGDSAQQGLLLGISPGSPVSPVSTNPSHNSHSRNHHHRRQLHQGPTPHQGPSRIGPFLLLPLADREGMHSAMDTDTGDELLCKVCATTPHPHPPASLCNFFE